VGIEVPPQVDVEIAKSRYNVHANIIGILDALSEGIFGRAEDFTTEVAEEHGEEKPRIRRMTRMGTYCPEGMRS
jgi:hypothetical protein